MKNGSLQIEEVLSKASIQYNLHQLHSEDQSVVREGLHTLASIASLTQRRDCLIALAGYYVLHVKSPDEIEQYVAATQFAGSPEITHLVLKDLVRIPELSRRRIFMNDLVRILGSLKRRFSEEQGDQIMELIESSTWGQKQKLKFKDEGTL